MKDLVPSIPPPFLPAWSSSLAVCLAAFVGLSLATPAVVASPIAYQFSGVIDAADPSTGVASGTPFSGTFAYDPATQQSTGGNGTLRSYGFDAPNSASLTLNVGGKPVFSSNILGVTVNDNTQDFLSNPSLQRFTSVGMGFSDGFHALSLTFENPTNSIDPTLQLPTSFSLADYPKAIISADLVKPGMPFPLAFTQYKGTITSLTPVPEPSALALPALLALGLGARRCWRWRGRRGVRGNPRSASA